MLVVLAGCASRSKTSEVMIDTSRGATSHVDPNAPPSQAWKLGDPTMSGREAEGAGGE